MYELKDHNVEVKSVFTGQHFDLIQPFMSQFDIQTDYTISTFSKNQSMTGLLASILQQVDETIDVCENDKWIVQGDTTSTFAVSVVAFLKKIPVYHVEAGLRTYNMSSPFPEEFYRKTVSSIASTHFAPTKKSAKALFAEGIRSTSVHIVGNTVIDMARIMRQKIEDTLLPFDSLDIHDRFIFMTMHRRENQHIMESYYSAVGDTLKDQNVSVIVSVHPNPVSRSIADSACKKYSAFVCVDALDYMTTHKILKESHIIITDSGGLQEESTWYKKPVIVLRNTTERTEAIDAGVSVLATSVALLQQYIGELLDVSSNMYKKMSHETYPFGDGYAAKRIVNIITNLYDDKMISPYDYSGIPKKNRVMRSMKSHIFKEMESYSNAWLKRNEELLQQYSRKWVLDSFHWWSRVWEYPWTFARIKENVKPNMKVLDLGAGVSFFHWYLKDTILKDSELVALDYDKTYIDIYKKLNANEQKNVIFKHGDMRQLNMFKDNTFDIIYSVSVLEHTNQYNEILDEIFRILKPGGKLVLTMDISFNGSHRDIPIQNAKEFRKYILTKFHEGTKQSESVFDLVDCITPEYAMEDKTKYAWVPPHWYNGNSNISLTVFSEVFTNDEKKQIITTCGASQFPSLDACSIKDSIDVFLTVFKRNTLAYQLDQVRNQTKRVSNIFVVQNENHVSVTEILETWRENHPNIPIHHIYFGKNSRFHGRFFTAYMLSNAEYVSIWDDDINVGERWLEYSIEQSKLHSDALVGANGRTLINIRDDNQKQRVFATEDQKNKMHTCDFVGHVWTLKRELLRFYVGDIQFTHLTGEDMQLSRSLQKRGYSSIVPKMWANGYYVFDTKEATDKHASYINIAKTTILIRERLFCQMIRDGFQPLQCSNCDAEKIDTCIPLLTSYIAKSHNGILDKDIQVGYKILLR